MLPQSLSRLGSQRTLSCAKTAVLLSTARGAMPPSRPVSPRHSTRQGCLDRRTLSTPAPHVNHSDLPINRYHALADATMTSLLERLENLLDEMVSEGFEVEYHSGVLTLNLGSNGTYVINKQPPNKQIWLSSPVSGPKRYDYMPSTDSWQYSRDGEEMGVLLEQELSRAFGRKVKLGLEHVSEAVE